MQENNDAKGNVYYDVANIRITALPNTWDDHPGIRIQAYTGEGNKLFPGAELPIPDKETAFNLLAAIHKAIETNENS